jgi:hypothetical protein
MNPDAGLPDGELAAAISRTVVQALSRTRRVPGSGVLEPRHVRPLLGEQERLHRHVLADVGV